ncbi:hypothetical protein SteCoe_4864 [Stentor coeruleus]|uniref:SAM domain-containing protein n=1 Tax=Stentor coeruleus TaxID=5963 RepID=A0A1R2CTS0_9CILI|nr:hypothetical protein SteCoe_4864 [Stentor coeruleus]
MNNSNAVSDFHNASTSIIIGDYIHFQSIISENPTLINEKEFGESLLHIAADNNQYDIAEFLLSLGVNPDIQTDSGESALHLSIFRSSKRIVNLLLSHKANPNLQNNELKSPLHYAAEFKEPDAIKALLLHGGNPTLIDINGLTPMDLAGDLANLFPYRFPMPMISEASPTEELSSTINSLNRTAIKSDRSDIRLKTKRSSSKEELFDFLCSISLKKYYKTMVSFGFDNLEALAFQMKTQYPITHKLLKTIGIEAYGDQSRLIANLEKVSCELYLSYDFITLDEFLDEIELGCYYENFVTNGYDNLLYILENSKTHKMLNDDILKFSLGIEKPGHRIRILAFIEFFSNKYFQHKCRCCLL